jgi:hypothetical protein
MVGRFRWRRGFRCIFCGFGEISTTCTSCGHNNEIAIISHTAITVPPYSRYIKRSQPMHGSCSPAILSVTVEREREREGFTQANGEVTGCLNFQVYW